MAEMFAEGGVMPWEKAAEVVQYDSPCDYVISVEFAEKLVALSNEGHKASPHEVAAVMARLREELNA